MAQRIIRYAKLVGPENVIAGRDCGFGTSAGMDRVQTPVVWEKLKTMREGAELASRNFGW